MSQIFKMSQSKSKVLKLTFDRELHFGPFVFSVEIEGFTTERRLGDITEDLCWSDNERYLALVEIDFDAKNRTNISNLNLVDTETGSITLIKSKAGLIKPKAVSNKGDIDFGS